MTFNRHTWRMTLRMVCAALLAVGGCESPTAPDPGAFFTKLTLGLQHTCGLTSAGEVFCWGEGGVLGTGSSAQVARPTKVAGDRLYFDLATGTHTTCALDRADSTAYCWGRGENDWKQSVPMRIATVGFKAISIGQYDNNHCGFTADGEVHCWGGNVYGQAGNGTRNPVENPTPIASILRASIVAAGYHACLLTVGGEAHCWGSNIQGAVGNSSTTPTCEPVEDCMITTPSPVLAGHAFTSISVGDHTCAIALDQKGYCWGANRYGQVGAPSVGTCKPIIPCNPTPALVAGLTFKALTARASSTCGVTTDGRGYCWGYNEEGQLGNGNRDNQSQPSAVAGDIEFRVIIPGIRHTCGVAVSGRAYCWGNNIVGGLGIGTFGGLHTSPVAVLSPLK